MPLACSWKNNFEKSGAYHGYVLHRSLRKTAPDVINCGGWGSGWPIWGIPLAMGMSDNCFITNKKKRCTGLSYPPFIYFGCLLPKSYEGSPAGKFVWSKAWLYFLRKLKPAHLPQHLLTNFHQSTIESLLTYCCRVCFSSCTTRDRRDTEGPAAGGEGSEACYLDDTTPSQRHLHWPTPKKGQLYCWGPHSPRTLPKTSTAPSRPPTHNK